MQTHWYLINRRYSPIHEFELYSTLQNMDIFYICMIHLTCIYAIHNTTHALHVWHSWPCYILEHNTFFLNHYAPVSQANWCNMNFTAGILFPCHTCIGWPESSPLQGFEPGSPAWEVSLPHSSIIRLRCEKIKTCLTHTYISTLTIMLTIIHHPFQSALWHVLAHVLCVAVFKEGKCTVYEDN